MGDPIKIDYSAPADQIMWRSVKPEPHEQTEVQWRGQPFAINVPAAQLREASSVADLGIWYSIGEGWAQIAQSFCQTDAPRVLDIGCGAGKVGRFFYMNPRASYLGLDVYKPAIEWSRAEFGHVSRFRFEQLDVRSTLYNPDGTMEAEKVTLPVADESADLVIAASLFTHLLEPEFKRYLSEIARVLSPIGRAVVSTHNEPDNGRFSGAVTRIDISDAYFSELVDAAGLSITDHVGNVFSQQVFVLKRK